MNKKIFLLFLIFNETKAGMSESTAATMALGNSQANGSFILFKAIEDEINKDRVNIYILNQKLKELDNNLKKAQEINKQTIKNILTQIIKDLESLNQEDNINLSDTIEHYKNLIEK